MLLLTAFIWGTAFVAQSVGMDYLGPFSFNGIRCLIGAVALLPCIWFLNRMNKDTETDCSEKKNQERSDNRRYCMRGIIIHSGQSPTGWDSVYHSGKSRIYYCFLYRDRSVLGIFFIKNQMEGMDGSVTGTCRIVLLCITESFLLKEIFWYFVCTCFSVHILVIDHFSPKVDGVKMSCIQFS